MKNSMGLHRGGICCTFQGQFPVKDTGEDGFAGIASKSFPRWQTQAGGKRIPRLLFAASRMLRSPALNHSLNRFFVPTRLLRRTRASKWNFRAADSEQESMALRRFPFQQAETTREQERTRFRLAGEWVTLASECAAEEERREAGLIHARREADLAAIAEETERDRSATANMRDIRLTLLDTLPRVSSGLRLGQIKLRTDMVTDLVRGLGRMIFSQPAKDIS